MVRTQAVGEDRRHLRGRRDPKPPLSLTAVSLQHWRQAKRDGIAFDADGHIRHCTDNGERPSASTVAQRPFGRNPWVRSNTAASVTTRKLRRRSESRRLAKMGDTAFNAHDGIHDRRR